MSARCVVAGRLAIICMSEARIVLCDMARDRLFRAEEGLAVDEDSADEFGASGVVSGSGDESRSSSEDDEDEAEELWRAFCVNEGLDDGIMAQFPRSFFCVRDWDADVVVRVL